MVKPVYIFSGFLDAGKTTAIKESLWDQSFNAGEKSLILVFEQGDEEYDSDFLHDTNSEVVYYHKLDELTKEEMKKVDSMYKPERIIIELNGMEDETRLFKPGALIKEWEIAQALTFFDGSTLRLYMNNMKQFVFNHVINTEEVYINRCKEDDVMFFRNNLKAINPRAAISFLDEKNKFIQNISSKLFDTSKDLIIDDTDYGLWYIDAVDDPYKYDGCKITLKMQYIETLDEYENVCVMGRKAMVCCSNDIQNAAITVAGVDPKVVSDGQFYQVTGKLKCMETPEFTTCVLYADDYQPAAPPLDLLVNFNY